MGLKTEIMPGGALLKNVDHFEPEDTFSCGQCFRFDKCEDGSYSGVAIGRKISVKKTNEGEFFFKGENSESIKDVVKFLSLDEDYGMMGDDILASMEKSGVDLSVMEKAIDHGKGIRIMKQDRWETLCSFIISQNNNIPRIKKIIETLCRRYGESFSSEGETLYLFPTPQKLFSAGEGEIYDCRTGFRAKYIIDAAEKVADKKVDLDKIDSLDESELLGKLMSISGVGPKVASCVALFGYYRISAFPIDVWVKRILEKYYPDIPSPEVFGKYAGLAQQYLFHYERSL